MSFSISKRITELDGLRGLAILMVLLHHFSAGGAIYRVASVGWIGVDLFFVLSGFLITGILVNSKQKVGYYRDFVIRRMFRIFPLYYGLLAIVALIWWHGSAPGGAPEVGLWWYAGFLGNIRGAMLNTYGSHSLAVSVFWSLQVEEQFYLLYPFLVAKLTVEKLQILLVSCVVAAPLLRLALLTFIPHSEVASSVLMPCRMDSLAFGGLVAIGLRQRRLSLRWVQPLALSSGVLAAASLVATRGHQSDKLRSLTYTLVGLAFSSTVAWILLARQARPEGFLLRGLRSRPLVYVGEISYGLYLLHAPAGEIARGLISHYIPLPKGSLPAVGVSLAAAFLAASISWKWYESPILSLKERFTTSSRSLPQIQSGVPTASMASETA